MPTLSPFATVDGEAWYEAEGEAEDEAWFEDESEAWFEAEDEAEGEAEDEAWFEDEAEDEGEGFVNPVRRVYADAEMMAHLGALAGRAESEEEGEAFIGALVPLAAKLVPTAARALASATPQLIKGASLVSRELRRNPRTRQLVLAMPTILERTVQSVADQVQAGRPLSGDLALKALARQTSRVLTTPTLRSSAVRRTQRLERVHHRRSGRGGRRVTGR